MRSLCVLTMAHVSANVARGQPAYQSSTFIGTKNVAWEWSASLGVDGSTDIASCTHTLEDLNPWWAVDLGARRNVIRVDLTNRADCCGK